MTRGKIVTISGSDGSGKATQTKLLIERAKKEGYEVETLSFPQYKSFWGKVVSFYLKGKFGSLKEINPRDASMLYSLDRLSAKEKIVKWLRDGKNMIFDRYIESNYGHQGGKFKGEEREEMLSWLHKLEVVRFGMPDSDLVIYLDLPVEWSLKAMKGRKRTYLKGKEVDIHEKDIKHLVDTQETYNMLVRRYDHWIRIPCLDKDGKRISREELTEIIWEIVQPHLIKKS